MQRQLLRLPCCNAQAHNIYMTYANARGWAILTLTTSYVGTFLEYGAIVKALLQLHTRQTSREHVISPPPRASPLRTQVRCTMVLLLAREKSRTGLSKKIAHRLTRSAAPSSPQPRLYRRGSLVCGVLTAL